MAKRVNIEIAGVCIAIESEAGLDDWDFPEVWTMVDDRRVVSMWDQVLPADDDGHRRRQPGISVLYYAGDGRFCYEMDLLNMTHVLADLGASVIYLPAGEVYQALERGIIDATELGGRATNLKFGLHEVTKYCYYPGVHAPAATADLYVNRDSFEALPPEYQQILEMEVRYCAMTTLLMIPTLNAPATQEFIEYGVEFIELPIEIQAYIIQAADEMWNSYGAEDPFFQEVYDNQKAFVKGYTSVASVVQPNVSMLLDYDL